MVEQWDEFADGMAENQNTRTDCWIDRASAGDAVYATKYPRVPSIRPGQPPFQQPRTTQLTRIRSKLNSTCSCSWDSIWRLAY